MCHCLLTQFTHILGFIPFRVRSWSYRHTHTDRHTRAHTALQTHYTIQVWWSGRIRPSFGSVEAAVTSQPEQGRNCVCARVCVGGGAITQSPHQFHTQHTHTRLYPLQSLHHSINESFHHSITPSMNHSIIPSMHHSINESFHQFINASFHQCITPSFHHSINHYPSAHISIHLGSLIISCGSEKDKQNN